MTHCDLNHCDVNTFIHICENGEVLCHSFLQFNFKKENLFFALFYQSCAFLCTKMFVFENIEEYICDTSNALEYF